MDLLVLELIVYVKIFKEYRKTSKTTAAIIWNPLADDVFALTALQNVLYFEKLCRRYV